MLTKTQRPHDPATIRHYINQTLCERDKLEIDCFPLTERILLRNGKPCGIYYCLIGPRSLRLSAIWDTENGTILFYGSRGERFLKTQLTASLHCQRAFVTEAAS